MWKKRCRSLNDERTKIRYRLVYAVQKDYKRSMKRHLDINLLDDIIRKLSYGEPLDEVNKDHALTGNWSGFRECHIEPDWLLIYKIEDDVLVLTLTRTGTHSDLLEFYHTLWSKLLHYYKLHFHAIISIIPSSYCKINTVDQFILHWIIVSSRPII